MTTNYTLDLNAGLTQVLADGTNTYLYGNVRIAQAGSTTEYFLGDALGSVRQLADTTAAVTLTQSYAPYGEVMQSIGTSQTSYAFTGESLDANGLIYLRARYYAPQDGRFISRDTWSGNYNRPLSLNRWGYVEGNPINLVDPSGHCAPSDDACLEFLAQIENRYQNITIDVGFWNIFGFNCDNPRADYWTIEDLQVLDTALSVIKGGIVYLGGDFEDVIGQLKIKRLSLNAPNGNQVSHVSGGRMHLTNSWVNDVNNWSRIKTVIHEMGHIVTSNQPDTMNYFMTELGAKCIDGITNLGVSYCFENTGTGQYDPGIYAGDDPWNASTLTPGEDTHTPSAYAESGNWEDYAETFYTVVLEGYYQSFKYSGDRAFLHNDIVFLYSHVYKNIGRRRDVMRSIIDGTWSVSQ